jgi:hypothetical protein
MAIDSASYELIPYPKTEYIHTLLIVGVVEIALSWLFLALSGLVPNAYASMLQPITAILGFVLIGVGVIEFGVVVVTVQLAWILPDDHDESGVSPFLCGYCLLGQSLLMFPPTIMIAIFLVPLLTISLSWVGWYFQKFTSLKLSTRQRPATQKPLSMSSLLWMPAALLGLGAMPLLPLLFLGPTIFDLAMTNQQYIGFVVICSSIAMASIAIGPLTVCYGYLFLNQCSRGTRSIVIVAIAMTLVMAFAVEFLASDYTSAVVPYVAIAMVLFAGGVWAGLRPWELAGLHVVIAKPLMRAEAIEDIPFDQIV